MRVQVQINQEGLDINEMFEGRSADEVVGKMKAKVASKLNFAMRLAVNAMSNLMFAQEVVKRYNEAKKQSLPIPASCEEFIRLAAEQGFATIEQA